MKVVILLLAPLTILWNELKNFLLLLTSSNCELPASKFSGSEPVRARLCQEIVLLEHPRRGMYDVIQNFEVIGKPLDVANLRAINLAIKVRKHTWLDSTEHDVTLYRVTTK